MDRIKRQAQREMDAEILNYVRGMQKFAPVTSEGIYMYLKNTVRRKTTEMDVEDRLIYLTDAGYLKKETVWDGGEVVRYEITATGIDLLDGNIPPRNWNGKHTA